MSSQEWKYVKWGSGAVVVLALLFLKIGATLPVFIAIGVVAAVCAGVFKYADNREGEALAREQRGL